MAKSQISSPSVYQGVEELDLGNELPNNRTPAHNDTPQEIPDPEPPSLAIIHKRSKTLYRTGIVIAVFDLCLLPITFFYALIYGTTLTQQYGMPPRLCYETAVADMVCGQYLL
jgi:hypothetical protein